MKDEIGSSSRCVVGVGQASLDFLGRVPDYPEADQKVEIGEFLMQGGGPVATALVALSRWGIRTAFVGRVGGDDFGRQIRQGLLHEGVDCRYLLTDESGTSQFAFIAVEEGSAKRTIFWTRGSALPLPPDEIPSELIASARVLHLDGLHRESSLAAARIARKNKVLTVLDGGTWRDGTLELLPFIDHLVVSEKFARQGVGDDPLQALPRLLEHGAQSVTVTMGEQGSHTLTSAGEAFHQHAFPVDAVDTTGCGDVFHGGFIYGLLQNWPLRKAVSFASACAALKTRALGGRTAIPSRMEVDAIHGADETGLFERK